MMDWKGHSEFGRVRGRGSHKDRSSRIDLGLALLQLVAKPGVELTQQDIAAWCGCARGNIHLIEKRALRKLRNRLRFIKDPALVEAVRELTEGRPWREAA